MSQTTHTVEQGKPITVNGVTIELQQTGKHREGQNEVATATIVVSPAS
jgi:hypothetical protein